MSSLADREKLFLLDLARRALVLGVEGSESLEICPLHEEIQKFHQPGGAFVTLRLRKRLRGCIGQLPSNIPLLQVVAHCAKAAALEDPRFGPVVPDEIGEIDIEISILSFPEDVKPEEIEPGCHGLIVSRGFQRGLLLPQVAAEFHWSAQRFLEETCIKGGLEPGAWRENSTRIQAFTAEVFSESSLRIKPEESAWPGSGRPGYSSST
jgi:AmmeMemoRadiSam system protein A